MTTPAQTTLLHAAELLEAQANKMRIDAVLPAAQNIFWGNKSQAREAHDDALTTALELRLLAKRINGGQIAVPPAPYVASKVEQQVLGKALFRSAKIPAPTFERK